MGLVSRKFSLLFSFLGEYIALNYKKCIFIPLLVTAILGYGITYYNYVEDMQYLYTVSGGENKLSKQVFQKYFPQNPEAFDASRELQLDRFLKLIVMTKDESSILKTEVWDELLELQEIVMGLEIENKNFSALCAQWLNECQDLNTFLDMKSIIPEIENGSLRLSYPIMYNPKTYNAHPLAVFMGGFDLTDDSRTVKSVKAVQLNYLLKVTNEEEDQRGREWERTIAQVLEKADSKWEHIKVYRLTLFSYTDEMVQNVYSALPATVIVSVACGAFVIISSMMKDWVKSKPILGSFAVTSAILATISAFGLLSYFGVPLIVITIAVPFLLMGIGMDDSFVMLAAWRRTNPLDPVPKRLSEAYSEAAVSITITSLTDMLSFYVGCISPIPCVQFFCAYAGTGVLLIYFYQVFFFGGLMSYFGYLEAENRHSVFLWRKAIPKSKSADLGFWKRTFLTGGYDESDPKNPLNNSENSVMAFFRDRYSTFICKTPVKIFFMLVFLCYVCISCWGLTKIKEGLQMERLVRYDCEMAKFIEKDDQYFKRYPYRVQVIVATPLDYSSNSTQSRINEMMDEIYGLKYMTSEFSDNWLRGYTRYIENYRELYDDVNITTEEEFNAFYLEKYISDRMPTSLDVKFNEDNSTILATRYIVQTQNLWTNEDSKLMLLELRDVVNRYQDLNATVFNNILDFVDQFIVIRELTVKLVIIAAIVVIFTTIIFIPNIPTTLAVLFSIVLIELGVLGFMGHWNINLDLISIIALIACIGFSVDFSAHISYAYISCEAETSAERIREAMYSLGLPILQSGISTVIGVLALFYVPVYSYHVFVKIIILVIVFAIFHGLVVLPILFSLFKPERHTSIPCSSKRKSYSLKK